MVSSSPTKEVPAFGFVRLDSAVRLPLSPASSGCGNNSAFQRYIIVPEGKDRVNRCFEQIGEVVAAVGETGFAPEKIHFKGPGIAVGSNSVAGDNHQPAASTKSRIRIMVSGPMSSTGIMPSHGTALQAFEHLVVFAGPAKFDDRKNPEVRDILPSSTSRLPRARSISTFPRWEHKARAPSLTQLVHKIFKTAVSVDGETVQFDNARPALPSCPPVKKRRPENASEPTSADHRAVGSGPDSGTPENSLSGMRHSNRKTEPEVG